MLNNHNIIKLARRKYRPLIIDYIKFLQMGWRDFGNVDISPEIRQEKLNLLDRALRKDCTLKTGLIYRLQQNFLQENLSISMLLEPLSAWRWLASGKKPDSELQAVEIINRMLAPLARLFLALEDENPSTYQPMTALLVLICWQEMLGENNDFLRSLKLKKKQKNNRLDGLYKTASVILRVIKSKRLKFRLAILLNTANIHSFLLKNNKQQKLSVLDYLRIFLYSTLQFLLVRKKTVDKKGI